MNSIQSRRLCEGLFVANQGVSEYNPLAFLQEDDIRNPVCVVGREDHDEMVRRKYRALAFSRKPRELQRVFDAFHPFESSLVRNRVVGKWKLTNLVHAVDYDLSGESVYDILRGTPQYDDGWFWTGTMKQGDDLLAIPQSLPNVIIPSSEYFSVRATMNAGEDANVPDFWTDAHADITNSTYPMPTKYSLPREADCVDDYAWLVLNQTQSWTGYMRAWCHPVDLLMYTHTMRRKPIFTLSPRVAPVNKVRSLGSYALGRHVRTLSSGTLSPWATREIIDGLVGHPSDLSPIFQYYVFTNTLEELISSVLPYGGIGYYQQRITHPRLYFYKGPANLTRPGPSVLLRESELPPIQDFLSYDDYWVDFPHGVPYYNGANVQCVLPPIVSYYPSNQVYIVASTPELLFSNMLTYARKPAIDTTTYSYTSVVDDAFVFNRNLPSVTPVENVCINSDTTHPELESSGVSSLIDLVTNFFSSIEVENKLLKISSLVNVISTLRDAVMADKPSYVTICSSIVTFLESFSLVSRLGLLVKNVYNKIYHWVHAWFQEFIFDKSPVVGYDVATKTVLFQKPDIGSELVKTNSAPDLMSLIASTLALVMSVLSGFELLPKTVINYFRDTNTITRFFQSTKTGLMDIFSSIWSDQATVFSSQLSELVARKEFYCTNPTQEFITDRAKLLDMRDIVKQYADLLSKIPSKDHRHYTTFFQKYNSLSSTFNEVLRALEAYHNNTTRPEPLGVLLVGPTAVGKSHMAQRLSKDLAKLMGWSDRLYACTLLSESDYNAPIGDEKIMIVDEFMSQQNAKVSSMILPMFSTMPMQMQGAAIQDKNQYVKFQMVVGTTNTEPFTIFRSLPHHEEASRKAFLDRFLIVKVAAPNAPTRDQPNPDYWKNDMSHAVLTLANRSTTYENCFVGATEISYHWLLARVHKLAVQREIEFWLNDDQTKPARLVEYQTKRISLLREMQLYDLLPQKVTINQYNVTQTSKPDIKYGLNIKTPDIVEGVIKNASGQDFFILRLQGPAGVGKTRFIHQTVTRFARLLQLPIEFLVYNAAEEKFSPEITKRAVIVVDDKLLESNYKDWLAYTGALHPASVVVIATNNSVPLRYYRGTLLDDLVHTYKSICGEKFPLAWDINVPAEIVGIARRLGLAGTVLNRSGATIDVNSEYTVTLEFDSMLMIHDVSTTSNFITSSSDVLLKLVLLYKKFISNQVELVNVDQPHAIFEPDLHIVAKTQEDLFEVLSSKIGLLNLYKGSFKSDTVSIRIDANLIHSAKSIQLNDLSVTMSQDNILEMVPQLVARLRRIKSDVTAYVEVGGTLITVSRGEIYTGKHSNNNIVITVDGGLIYIKNDCTTIIPPTEVASLEGEWNQNSNLSLEQFYDLSLFVTHHRSELQEVNEFYRKTYFQKIAEHSLNIATMTPMMKETLRLGMIALGFGATLYASVKIIQWLIPTPSESVNKNDTEGSSDDWTPHQKEFQKSFTRHLNDAKIRAPKDVDFDKYWFNEYLPAHSSSDFMSKYREYNPDNAHLMQNQGVPAVQTNAIDIVKPLSPTPTTVAWRTPIYKNLVIVQGVGSAHGLMIHGRYGLTVAHVAVDLSVITVVHDGGTYEATIVKRYEHEDLVMFYVESGPAFTDIRKRFFEQPKLISGVTAQFLRTDASGHQAINGFVLTVPGTSRQGKQISTATDSNVDCYSFAVATGTPTNQYMAVGDCGFPLVYSNAVGSYILGIHFVWGDVNSYFTPVFQTHFELPRLDLPVKNHFGIAPWDVNQDTILEEDGEWDFGFYSPAFAIKDFRRKTEKPLRSRFEVELPIPDTFALAPQRLEDVKDQSRLLINPDTNKPDIAYSQLMKYATPVETNIDNQLYEHVEETLGILYSTWYPDNRLLTYHEVLNGCAEDSPMYSFVDGLDMSKSPGPTYSMLGAQTKSDCFVSKNTGQKHLFYNDRTHTLNSIFSHRLTMLETAVENHFPYVPHAKACLKRELLPLHKVDVGGTRVFIVLDLEAIAYAKRLYGFHIGLEKKHHLDAWCQLGMVVGSDFQLKFWPRRLELESLKLVDATRLDKYVPKRLRMSFAKMVASRTPIQGKTTQQVIDMYTNFEEIISSSAVWYGGEAYRFRRGIYSGEIGTTSKDTYAMSFMYLYALFKYARDTGYLAPSIEDIMDPGKNLVAIFGDDLIFSQTIFPDMPDSFLISAFKDFGIDVSFSTQPPFFLGNEITLMNGFIVPRPLKSTFERLLYWYSAKEDLLVQFAIILYSAALYDREYFDKIMLSIKLIIPTLINPKLQTDLRLLLAEASYDNLRRMAVTRVYDNKFTYLSDVLVLIDKNSKQSHPLLKISKNSVLFRQSNTRSRNNRVCESITSLDSTNIQNIAQFLTMNSDTSKPKQNMGPQPATSTPPIDVRTSNIVQNTPRDNVTSVVPTPDVSVPHDAVGLGIAPTMLPNTYSSLQQNTLGIINPVNYRPFDVPESAIDMRTISELAYQPFTAPGTIQIDTTKTTGTVLAVFPYGPKYVKKETGKPDVLVDNPYLSGYAKRWINLHAHYCGDIAYTISIDGPEMMQGSVKWAWMADPPQVGDAVDWADAERVEWCEIKVGGHSVQTILLGDARQSLYYRNTDGSDLTTNPPPALVLFVYHPIANQFQTGEIKTYANVLVRSQLQPADGTGNPFLAYKALNPGSVLKTDVVPKAALSLPVVTVGNASDIQSNNPRYWMFTDGNARFTLNRTYTPCSSKFNVGAAASKGVLKNIGVFPIVAPQGFPVCSRTASNIPDYKISESTPPNQFRDKASEYFKQIRNLAQGQSFMTTEMKDTGEHHTEGEARIVGPAGVFLFAWRDYAATEDAILGDDHQPFHYNYTEFTSPTETLPSNFVRLVISETEPCTVQKFVSVATDVCSLSIVSRLLDLAVQFSANEYLLFELFDAFSSNTLLQAAFSVRERQIYVKFQSSDGSYYRTAPYDLTTLEMRNFVASSSLTDLKVLENGSWSNRFVEDVAINMMKFSTRSNLLNPGSIDFMRNDLASGLSRYSTNSLDRLGLYRSGSISSLRSAQSAPGALASDAQPRASISSSSSGASNLTLSPHTAVDRYRQQNSPSTSPSTNAQNLSSQAQTETTAATAVGGVTTGVGMALQAIPVVGNILGLGLMAGGAVASAGLQASAMNKRAEAEKDVARTQAAATDRRTAMLDKYVAQSPSSRLSGSM